MSDQVTDVGLENAGSSNGAFADDEHPVEETPPKPVVESPITTLLIAGAHPYCGNDDGPSHAGILGMIPQEVLDIILHHVMDKRYLVFWSRKSSAQDQAMLQNKIPAPFSKRLAPDEEPRLANLEILRTCKFICRSALMQLYSSSTFTFNVNIISSKCSPLPCAKILGSLVQYIDFEFFGDHISPYSLANEKAVVALKHLAGTVPPRQECRLAFYRHKESHDPEQYPFSKIYQTAKELKSFRSLVIDIRSPLPQRKIVEARIGHFGRRFKVRHWDTLEHTAVKLIQYLGPTLGPATVSDVRFGGWVLVRTLKFHPRQYQDHLSRVEAGMLSAETAKLEIGRERVDYLDIDSKIIC